MAWFGKKDGEEHEENLELPRLPELPRLNDFEERNSLPQLPSYPQTHFGNDFSKNVIKDAIVGKKEGETDFADDSYPRMMQKPNSFHQNRNVPEFRKKAQNMPKQNMTKEIPRFAEKPRVREVEPIYVRFDKLEESAKIFEDAKSKIMEIERNLGEIKRIKETEENELEKWESEIQEIKNHLEKIDREVFSRV